MRVEQHAVHAVAHPQVVLGGLEVDVGGAVGDGLVDEQVDEPHDRRVLGDLGEPVEVRAAVVAEVEVGAERRQLALGPVVLGDPVHDLGTPGEHEPDPAAGQPRDVVLELEVADRLHRHRDLEQVALDGDTG